VDGKLCDLCVNERIVKSTRTIFSAGVFAAMLASAALGQDRPAAGDAGAVQAGGSLFREKCAECHGTDARGVAGHDLTRIFASGATDDRVFQTIRQGVPNTIMPSSTAPDSEIWALVSYIRSLNGSGTAELARGNADNGERIFWASCGNCHIVNGRGGPLGPDLTRITQNQSREQLTRAVRDPNASIPDGYRTVTVVTRDGQRVRGVRKSEDAFSIQMMDEGGHLRGFLKSGIREVISETSSLMPAFGSDRLNENDLTDVLAFLGRK
jgi:cytochrome c oxidase cbb3-type subunit III